MGNILCKKNKVSKVQNNKNNDQNSSKLSLEDDTINSIVDRYLKNPSMNNTLLPDVVERMIYINILRMLIGILNDSFANAHIDMLGHRVTFFVQPLPTTPLDNSVSECLQRHNSTS